MNFNEIYNKYYAQIYKKICIIVKDDEVAKDLASEVFYKIDKRLNEYDKTFSLSTWINRIAVNHAIDYLRYKNRRPVNIGLDAIINWPSDDTSEMNSDSEKITNIKSAMTLLSKKSALVFSLFYFENKTYKEIAKELKISEMAIKTSLYKSRLVIKQFIKNKDV